jgi:hypothetical protein
MGRDINIIWEIKEQGKWIPLMEKPKQNGALQIFKRSSLENNFMGLLLHGEHLCGWYRDEEVVPLHEFKKGAPIDTSIAKCEDYFTNVELESFNWNNINIPYEVSVNKKDYELYKNGADPLSLSFATGRSGESFYIKFDIPFTSTAQNVLEELEEMKKYKEYRMLVYYD